MNDDKTVKDLKTITMPIEFQEALFKPLKDDSFMLGIFRNDKTLVDRFMSILDEQAGELSDDFNADEWAIGKEIDFDHHTFFLYPVDDTKTYIVKGSAMPSSQDLGYSSEYGYDADGDEYEDVVVDNKTFGLIATLATFGTYGYHDDDIELSSIYMDRGADLNGCVVDAARALERQMTSYSVELDIMMDILHIFLRDEGDDWLDDDSFDDAYFDDDE